MNRTSLLAMRCDTAAEVEAYRIAVIDLATAHCAEVIKRLPIDSEPAWANPSRVPGDVIRQAADSGVAPPSPHGWSRLSTLQRFALLKLARSDHDNHNFIPAMREMHLVGEPA